MPEAPTEPIGPGIYSELNKLVRRLGLTIRKTYLSSFGAVVVVLETPYQVDLVAMDAHLGTALVYGIPSCTLTLANHPVRFEAHP